MAQQQGKSRKSGQKSVRADAQDVAMQQETRTPQGSFVDALNATQQHTVPVLPAYDAPSPNQTETQSSKSLPAPTVRTAASPRTSYARATLAPRAGGMQHTNALPATAGDAGVRDVLKRESSTLRHTTAGRVRDTRDEEHATSGIRDAYFADSRSAGGSVSASEREPGYSDALPLNGDMEDDAEFALTPGRPTFVLPAITGERLPAVRPGPGERQLAVAESDEPQAVFIRGASKLPKPYLALAPRRNGPRPFIVQFLVAMVTVMTLSAVLALASPLGKSMAFSSGYQVYANAMPWIPTATPTPKPTPAPQFYGQQPGVNPGQQVITDTIKSVFGAYSAGALNIARCESGYDPNAYNSYPVAGSHAEGVFQILYPSTWSGTAYARYSPYDYNANIRAAYQIFHNDGNSWREWECQP